MICTPTVIASPVLIAWAGVVGRAHVIAETKINIYISIIQVCMSDDYDAPTYTATILRKPLQFILLLNLSSSTYPGC